MKEFIGGLVKNVAYDFILNNGKRVHLVYTDIKLEGRLFYLEGMENGKPIKLPVHQVIGRE